MRLVLLAAWLVTSIATAEELEQPAAELPDKAPMHTLGKVDAESNKTLTNINIRFSAPLNWDAVKLSDHGTFIQLELPNTVVPNPGDFLEGAGDYLKKMAVFQITPQTGALRLFVSSDALLVKQSLKADILGDRVLVTIDHEKLASLIANDPKVTATPATAKSAEEVISSTEVDDDLPEPASRLQSQTPATEEPVTEEATTPVAMAKVVQTGGGVFAFQDKLLSVSVFCGILLLGMLAFLFAAPRLRKARLALAPKDGVSLRSLATHTVAPKQKIELIDVAGQQVLIGVTPGNISFLTTISPRTQAVAPPAQQPSIQPRQVLNNHQPKQISQPAARSSSNSSQQKPIATKPASAYGKQQVPQKEAINDVTKLIREKLRNIPSV